MTPQQKAFAKETLLACRGYTPSFINSAVPVSDNHILPDTYKKRLPDVEGNKQRVLDYTDLRVWYDADRQVPFFSAYTVDGSQKAKNIVRANNFRADPRIPADIQLSQKNFYDLIKGQTEFEIGHMAANNEMAWGTDAQLKAYQTFHFPNSCPQAENLNTGIWKSLETYVITEAATLKSQGRIAVFTGPLLQANDPGYVKRPSFLVPLLFFKVIVFEHDKGMFSTAFVMSHEEKVRADKLLITPPAHVGASRPTPAAANPFADFAYKKVFQINMNLLSEQTGLNFSWKGVTPLTIPNDKHQIDMIRKIKDSKDAAAQERAAVGAPQKAAREAPAHVTAAKAPISSDTIGSHTRLSMILP